MSKPQYGLDLSGIDSLRLVKVIINKLVIRFVVLLSIQLPVNAFCQFSYTNDQSIPVENANGDLLSLPSAGGLNAAQFNTMDLDGDGIDDLVLFDKMANQVLTHLTFNNTLQYAPEYESLFPDGISRFMLLRDFNGDGMKDIFTGNNLGMSVLVNVTGQNGVHQWEQFYFHAGTSKVDQVLTQGFTQKM